MIEHKRATITSSDSGGFTAIASSDSVDRDGERIVVGAFNPLPKSIPVHLDHVMNTDRLVARARPYYDGRFLKIDAVFGSTEAASRAREMVREGLLDSVSVAFLNPKRRKGKDGVPEIYGGELYSCDLVTVPSNRDALVLSSRSFAESRSSLMREARFTVADAVLTLARTEIADAERVLRSAPTPRRRGMQRRAADLEIRSILTAPSYQRRSF